MGFFDRFRGYKREKDAELMKSLCLNFVADIFNTAIPKAEIPKKSIDNIEPIILGMFLVKIVYTLKNSDSPKCEEQIDMFHDTMENFLCNDIYLKSSMPKDTTSINNWISVIRYAANSRFKEYQETYSEDFSRHATILSTIKAFSKHLFIEPVSNDKLNTFIMVASAMFMMHKKICFESLK
jgi:hypothetical protein